MTISMSMFKKFFKFFGNHRFISAIIIGVLIGGSYWGYKILTNKKGEMRYVLAAVEKGTLITSVSGSGQISASNQVDIKPKVSGDVLSVDMKNGQEVKAGDVLIRLDTKDVYKTIRDAQSNLENAQLSLEKLKQPASDYSIWQAQNALDSAKHNLDKLKLSQETVIQTAQQTIQKDQDNMDKAVEDALNTITNVFLGLPTITTKLNDILYGNEISDGELTVIHGQNNIVALASSVSALNQEKLQIFQASAENDYKIARSKYDVNLENYNKVTRYSNQATIESLLTETIETVKAVAQAAKSENSFLGAWVDYRSQQKWPVFVKIKDYQAGLSANIGQANNYLSSLLSIETSLEDSRESVASSRKDLDEMEQNNPFDLATAEATIKDKKVFLADLLAGADVLDIKSQELSIDQKQDALADAREKLVDYTVRAPFDGVLIVNTDIKLGDPLGASTAVATIITKQRIVEISLNEVDVAKIKVSQKVNLTFDVISDLNLTGIVAEVDPLGTATQGVVSYNIKIIFDAQDDRVKPGMSVTASIITDVRQDVLMVPNAAIKSQGSTNYVEVLADELATNQLSASALSSSGITSATPPKQQAVEIGLSNDSMTEIISNLQIGDRVVTRTIAPTTSQSQATTQGQSILQATGANRSGSASGTRVPF
ncbi:MAG: hypothetical protein COY09_03080 [Candidatus Portnoybacteria bacterium CG_4_10_14_0_2_um_filter_39_11]|uniref:Uncharacterized protein n=1 Tax=Candidatus Portnoybacteria bacterium CG_4_10_14_0_2_um_filter_39_11 TaxID=1974797 RepID=A0A2M7UGQ4_9BACT|nr:MAG: hypothetical protein COY09_03080 [Candidatus Portnoybacteria bacterium CG_4_10_14_0_2_um_filter_39_11]